MNRILLASPLLLAALLACNEKKVAPMTTTSASASAAVTSPSAAPSASGALPPIRKMVAKPIPAPPDVAAPPPTAQKTETGLVTNVLEPGSGKEHPGAEDSVKVHYTGWTKDGVMFDSSVTRGRASAFRLNQVIPGWTEALQLMVAGEKRRLWVPGKLAYGDVPKRPGAPAGDLTFDVELLEITKAPEPPKPPPDLKNPPKSAKKTASGLVHEVLVQGKGASPGERDVVVVHYTGWTTDGKMFDSSVTRGQPARFRLNQVIRGWTEGVQLMKAGGKSRLYIPGPLAYGDKPTRPGAPSGPLVFEIELLEVMPARTPPPVSLPRRVPGSAPSASPPPATK